MTKKQSNRQRKRPITKKRSKYRIRYDIGSLWFGLLAIIGSLLPHRVLVNWWMNHFGLGSSVDRYIYLTLGTIIYNLWVVALFTGYLGEKNRLRNGKLVCGVLFGLIGLAIIVIRDIFSG